MILTYFRFLVFGVLLCIWGLGFEAAQMVSSFTACGALQWVELYQQWKRCGAIQGAGLYKLAMTATFPPCFASANVLHMFQLFAYRKHCLCIHCVFFLRKNVVWHTFPEPTYDNMFSTYLVYARCKRGMMVRYGGTCMLPCAPAINKVLITTTPTHYLTVTMPILKVCGVGAAISSWFQFRLCFSMYIPAIRTK